MSIEAMKQAQPVAWMRADKGHVDFHKHPEYLPLYTFPSQRQPLTDEQMYLAIRPLFRTDAVATSALQISKDEYRAIEAAHGIKGEE